MTPESAAFVAEVAAYTTETERSRAGLPKLHALYRDLVRATVPPNPQFERERIIADAPQPRELVFLLGLLSEGENEAGLLLDLADEVTRSDPSAPVAHIIDEAWYYLRTSIDERWQLDDGEACASAALAYLFATLTDRLEALRARAPLAETGVAERTGLLRSLRDRLTVPRAANATLTLR